MGAASSAGRGRAVVAALAALVSVLCVLAGPARAQPIQLSTQPSLYPVFDPEITDYVLRCTSNTPVDVTVSAPAGTTVDVDHRGAQTGDFTTSIDLNGGQAFPVITNDGTAVNTYFVRCLPSDFPSWSFERTGTPQAEWYLVSPFGRTDFQPVSGVAPTYGMIFDGNGVPVWWYKSGLTTLDFRLFPDGNVGFAHLNASAEERGLDGSLARNIVPPPGAGLDPHELLQLANGNYLVSVDRGLAGQTVCGQPDLTIGDNGFEELAPDGSLVRSWWASDHIPLTEVPAAWCGNIIGQPAAGPVYDPYHINSVEPDGNGFIMSFRHLDAVYRVNDTDGDVTWKLGGVSRAESLTVLNDPFAGDEFRGQHDARVLPGGSVTIHDNGFHPGGLTRPPRAVRYAIDTDAHTATLVQQLNDPGTVTTPLCCGSARSLPGGDWIMNWGSAGLTTELDSSGSRVFRLAFDQDKLFSYRANPVLPGQLSRAALRVGMDAQFPRGYARPRGTGRLRVPLVPAFDECTAPDTTHGAPLAYDSCSSPSRGSLLTIGTPDSNGPASNSTGYVAYRVTMGDPSTPASEADVRLRASITDVRHGTDLSDYTGELQLRGSIRITDRLSGTAGNEAATIQDTELPATVPCIATESDAVGASCALETTVNAVLPGAVVERKRTIWELGAVQVYDGGAGETAGAADARLFEAQGIFVP